ncbi:DNA cytosine methyltransferase [Pseudomonas syringae pv. syringae]|uniref:DNA cytosine methyltransferase n=1 Tax=Pseudomonas syringae TaxID=317 RepID=UPI00200B1447|nr:DNA cytosine methyltransferase [Pseudomonas syringae]MCK9740065.1 DNA cytosine methyltransferase [Pseudomonas syringae pv. syringae]
MNELALFAGAGGGILGGHLLGWRTVCAVERDAYAAQVLAQRQNDGALPTFPIWSDVCSFDGKPWRGLVDVVSGGFPCQDISAAGNGIGIDGARSGLWREMARIIGEIQPGLVLVENSPMLVGRGLAMVLGDLAEMGYDAKWCCVSAADCGAPHIRDRIWILAYPNSSRESQSARQQQNSRVGPEQRSENVAYAHRNELFGRSSALQVGRKRCTKEAQDNGNPGGNEWPAESRVGRMANGVANRVDRLKALGNGQVPRVAATAFAILQREQE